jgi:hypothetical protein
MSDVKKFLETIWTPGDVREIRAFDKLDGISYGYFDNIEYYGTRSFKNTALAHGLYYS